MRRLVLGEDGLASGEIAQIAILRGEEDEALMRVQTSGLLLGDH